MDLRTEKEKQRSVLMKLKEISTVDDAFFHACQENIGKIGFVLPTASRLTSQSSSKRAASLANSNRYAGGSGTAGSATGLFRSSTSKTSGDETGGAIYVDINKVPTIVPVQKQAA